MRRDRLEHAIRTACPVIGSPEVIVVGSQSILGTYREDELPEDATMSIEVDILPVAEDNDETARLADLIEGVAGEFSPFEELHGFSIDGVDPETSTLPEGIGLRNPRTGSTIRLTSLGRTGRTTSRVPGYRRSGSPGRGRSVEVVVPVSR